MATLMTMSLCSQPPTSSRFASLAARNATRRIDCLGTQFLALRLGSVFMIVVFVIGVPFFWLVSLLRVRESLHRTGPEGEPTMAAQNFDFLIGGYKPKYYLVSARAAASAPRRARMCVRACALGSNFLCAPRVLCFASQWEVAEMWRKVRLQYYYSSPPLTRHRRNFSCARMTPSLGLRPRRSH